MIKDQFSILNTSDGTCGIGPIKTKILIIIVLDCHTCDRSALTPYQRTLGVVPLDGMTYTVQVCLYNIQL